MCRLILTALDSAGILKTDPRDRGVKLVWPDPLPEDLHEAALTAKTKADLGIPEEHIHYQMLFGVPSIRYARTVQRDDGARVERIVL